jgi:hypothetical protein
MLKSFLYHRAKHNPCLAHRSQTIPFLKWLDVQPGGEEETDGVCHKLPIRVWVASQERRLGALFNVSE